MTIMHSTTVRTVGAGGVFDRRRAGFFGAAIVIVLGALYLARSRVFFLADGYIFLAYARNIADHFSWAINPPELTFATSSPLWTVLCAICAALIPKSYLPLAVQGLGMALFAGVMMALDSLFRRFAVPAGRSVLAIGIFAGIAFNGFYYAISAMETPLFMLLFIIFCLVISERSVSLIAVGVVAGLLFLTRVEGVLVLPAYCVARLTLRISLRQLVGELVVIGAIFAVVIAPWQVFLFVKTGGALPTSGAGRLYLYLPTVIGTSVAEYLATPYPARLGYIPKIIYGNFVEHPVVLASCLLPLVALIGVYFAALRSRISASTMSLVSFLVTFCSLNLAIYVLFQPLIFQRYLIVALPSFIVAATVVLSERMPHSNERAWPILGVGVSLFVLVVTHLAGVRYFDVPTTRDERVVGLFRALDEQTNGNCRLAAEPLGISAYFTHCYIIDLGGLINPDIWPLLIRGPDAKSELEYARAHGATHIYWNEKHPEVVSEVEQAAGSSGPEVIYRLRK
ncbi:hypothetical protein [Bradyrhizobium sp. Gha]|uniref:hypothetical protein n=1 Tax=Bradyrhizobium sp. Gha TaxID=1855318 RepID=UPI0008E2656D|nr:hypothetical protein [Bradyrhizobium sp. Gha]SFI08589.1 hypothetical protein SAMN05216525_10427 [Bradyrhizobium sp. Gha]